MKPILFQQIKPTVFRYETNRGTGIIIYRNRFDQYDWSILEDSSGFSKGNIKEEIPFTGYKTPEDALLNFLQCLSRLYRKEYTGELMRAPVEIA